MKFCLQFNAELFYSYWTPVEADEYFETSSKIFTLTRGYHFLAFNLSNQSSIRSLLTTTTTISLHMKRRNPCCLPKAFFLYILHILPLNVQHFVILFIFIIFSFHHFCESLQCNAKSEHSLFYSISLDAILFIATCIYFVCFLKFFPPKFRYAMIIFRYM